MTRQELLVAAERALLLCQTASPHIKQRETFRLLDLLARYVLDHAGDVDAAVASNSMTWRDAVRKYVSDSTLAAIEDSLDPQQPARGLCVDVDALWRGAIQSVRHRLEYSKCEQVCDWILAEVARRTALAKEQQ